MSFSSTVKEEMCRVVQHECCQKACLAGLLPLIGTLQVKAGQANLLMATENAAIARLAVALLKAVYSVQTDISVRQNQHLNKRQSYRISVPQALFILQDLGIWCDGLPQDGIEKTLVRKTCCKKALLRGAFLGGGSVSDPEKGYHLEFVVRHAAYAQGLRRIFKYFSLSVHEVERKGARVVYLKDSERIADALTLMGAFTAVLALENTRIIKEMRNQVNREVNCESANLDKIVYTAVRQRDAILYLQNTGELDKQPESLREVARLRLLHPECNLSELGAMLDPPLGKSGMHHRMRKLENAATELLAKVGEEM